MKNRTTRRDKRNDLAHDSLVQWTRSTNNELCEPKGVRICPHLFYLDAFWEIITLFLRTHPKGADLPTRALEEHMRGCGCGRGCSWMCLLCPLSSMYAAFLSHGELVVCLTSCLFMIIFDFYDTKRNFKLAKLA